MANLCMGCMSEKSEDEAVCKKCGYKEGSPYLPSYLAPGTELGERYIAGKLLSYNGEGAIYIGFDKVTGAKVTIKEYMPDTICSRKKGETAISVDASKTSLYKTYLSEFYELNHNLMKARSMTHVQTVLDIFRMNNTAYVVFEYITGRTLRSYLSESAGGILSWEKIKEIFPPILTTLSLVHREDIIHKGISPATIIVTEKDELKLIDFQISAGRSVGSEIACEVFPGFSAPEQYSANGKEGAWTDVYGICAVLYRALTGVTPAESIARAGSDNLPEPIAIGKNIPLHVSKTIMDGLKLNPTERIQNITELVTRLFEQPKAAARPAPTKPVTVPNEQPTAAKGKKKKNNTPAVLAGIITCSVLIVGFLVTIIVLANSDSGKTSSYDPNFYSAPESTTATTSTTSATTVTTPAPETSEPAEIYVCPDFKDRLYQGVVEKVTYLKITAEYDFNDDFPAGVIYKQSIPAEKEITAGTEIKLYVSKGPSAIPLPEFKNKNVDEYTKLLSSKNIKFEKKAIETDEVDENMVVKCSKNVGEKVNVEKSETVTVYYAKPKSADSKPETSETAE